jgi:predicted DNA-binding protein (MmcQ/YjbR family)
VDLESFRHHCLKKENVTEEFPFGEETLVYKVNGKIFAISNLETFESVNLKCDPEKAVELREQYAAVQPGYHMNKKHWNTVLVDGSVSDVLIKQWIDHSYQLVVSKSTNIKRPLKRK